MQIATLKTKAVNEKSSTRKNAENQVLLPKRAKRVFQPDMPEGYNYKEQMQAAEML
jgi:hypothetical protein